MPSMGRNPGSSRLPSRHGVWRVTIGLRIEFKLKTNTTKGTRERGMRERQLALFHAKGAA